MADGNHVYAKLGFCAPVSQITATTGDVVRTYDGTAFATEIVLHEDLLFVSAGPFPGGGSVKTICGLLQCRRCHVVATRKWHINKKETTSWRDYEPD